MIDQYKNFDAIRAFRCHAEVVSDNTVIVLRAFVCYTDKITQKILFRDTAEIFIDTTQEDKVSIPAFSYIDGCFSEFMTRYQSFEHCNGVLTISGDGFGTKHPYVITII